MGRDTSKAATDSNARNTKWLTPATQQKLRRNAKTLARVTYWETDVASLRIGVPSAGVVIIFLLFQQVGAAALITASLVSVFGVFLIAKILGHLAVRHIYKEELIKQADEWKNYYEILRLSPTASLEVVDAAHKRLLHLFKDVLSEETKEIGGVSLNDVNLASEVLSDNRQRAAYDRVFWMRANAQPEQKEIVASMQSVADVMESGPRESWTPRWQTPAWLRKAGQAAVAGIIGLLPVVVGGTSLAFAKPENTLAVPFRRIAMSVAKVSAGSIELVVDIRSIAASQERSTVATAFQAMRVDANLATVTPLSEPTNDMGAFPSAEHPLYPEYLETRFSQFKYNVDEYGVVNVDASTATTSAILDNLNDLLAKLEQ